MLRLSVDDEVPLLGHEDAERLHEVVLEQRFSQAQRRAAVALDHGVETGLKLCREQSVILHATSAIAYS